MNTNPIPPHTTGTIELEFINAENGEPLGTTEMPIAVWQAFENKAAKHGMSVEEMILDRVRAATARIAI